MLRLPCAEIAAIQVQIVKVTRSPVGGEGRKYRSLMLYMVSMGVQSRRNFLEAFERFIRLTRQSLSPVLVLLIPLLLMCSFSERWDGLSVRLPVYLPTFVSAHTLGASLLYIRGAGANRNGGICFPLLCALRLLREVSVSRGWADHTFQDICCNASVSPILFDEM